ncbi:MAG: IS66 family transposase [Bacillota bacterium]|nr:IS66 family transposase [Bacillota bacterium]
MENVKNEETRATETVTISRAEYDELTAAKSQVAELSQQVQYLLEQMRLARKKQFGASSEQSKYDAPEQLNLFNEAEFFANESSAEPELVEIETHYRKKRSETKDSLPEDLPVETMEHFLPENEQSCPKCGEQLHIIGKTVQRRLKLIPAQAVIVEDIYYTYSCRNCEKTGIEVPVIKVDMPSNVIKGSFATPEAVAHIMTQKFVMGSPLYRQEQELKRNGIMLSRQTMSNWLLKSSADWLEPVYKRMYELLLKETVLHADETTLQVLHEDGKKAQAKSYMWLYRTSGCSTKPIVLYDYQPDRKASRPKEFLEGFSGYLHADGYAGYHSLPENIMVVGCWAHARRKFDEALNSIPEKEREGSAALQGKRYCNKLFAIEKEIEKLIPESRFEERQKQAKPVLDEFLAWLKAQKAAPKSGLGKAVYYTLDQWKYLECYLEDGRLEISNNRAERSIKPFVIDRKNFLFVNTPRGAVGSAVMFSLIETAKENRINPYKYLTYIFHEAPNMVLNDPRQLESLLPWNAPDECKIPNAET